MQTAIQVPIFLGLTVGALFFIREPFKDYMEGNTSYAVTKEPISIFDLPTLTFCITFDQKHGFFTYGKDFFLEFTIVEDQGKTTILEENKSVQTLFNLKIHLVELLPRQENHLEEIIGTLKPQRKNRQCYKVSITVSEKVDVDFQKFGIDISMNFSDVDFQPDTKLWITSEENSYGLPAGERWFDGDVTGVDFLGLRYIVEVREYHNLGPTCS